MQIIFEERPIYQAPISVLEHLYYYTTQYGLSVKQFTGAHWSYWEKLPNLFREVQDDPDKLNSVISNLEQLASGSEERMRRRRSQLIEGKWQEKEIILNAQLLSVLAALPSELLALGFNNMIGIKSIYTQLKIVNLVMRGEKGEDINFVEPDLLLLGNRQLLMIEVKTRGGPRSSRKYPPYQLLNYLQLVRKCRDLGTVNLPEEFTHLILVPSTDPIWLENHREWVSESSDNEGRLRVIPDACIRLSKKKASYDYERLKDLINEIPIYYRSWQQMDGAFKLAIELFDDKRNHMHWRSIGCEINMIAARAGRYK